MKPYDVRIVAEGKADIISQFIEQIRIKKYPIDLVAIFTSRILASRTL